MSAPAQGGPAHAHAALLAKLPEKNLARLVLDCAAADAPRRAIATMDESVTHGQFRDLTIGLALHMRQRGIGQGARVAITAQHPIISLGLTLACSLLGCSWTIAVDRRLTHPFLRVTHLVHLGLPPAGARVPCLAVDASWSRPPPAPPGGHAPFAGQRAGRDLWLIAQSSGSTGAPKLISLSEDAMYVRNLDAPPGAATPHPTMMVLFPLLSAPSMMALRTLYMRGSVIFAQPEEIFGGTRIDIIFGSPNHLATMMDHVPPGRARAHTALIAGAPPDLSFLERLFGYAGRVVNLYASTEAGLVSTEILTPETLRTGRPLGGTVHPSTEVQIVDAEDAPLPHGAEGILRIRNTGLASGYLGEADLTAHVFRNGWFHPGDLGRINPDFTLSLLGRADNLINIGGSKVDAERVEELLRASPGIRDAACLARPTSRGLPELVAAIVASPGAVPSAIAHAIMASLRPHIAMPHIPRALFFVPEIPRNANGKVMRHELPNILTNAAMAKVPMPDGSLG